MFPLSHIYVATEVLGCKSPLLILGSILPDINSTSQGRIARGKIHDAPNDFFKFIQTWYPDFLDLAKGVNLHSGVDKGADHYSDDNETGFATVEGKRVSDKVAKLLGEDINKSVFVLAHNFIEAALDIHLARSHPQIVDMYEENIPKVGLLQVADCLSAYLQQNSNEIFVELQMMLKMLASKNLVSPQAVAENLIVPFQALRNKIVNQKDTQSIVEEAIKITEPSYEEFFRKTIAQMSTDFSELRARPQKLQ